uniref:Putative terminase n=1 Tax=viral metagenome TaxID=1070528 RepID=A0A6M3LM34_9ZZZZ
MDDGCPFYSKIPTDRLHNLYWRKEVYKKVMEDQSYCAAIYRVCQLDPLFFMNGFVWTFDPRKKPITKIPFILYPYQEQPFIQILSAINNHDLLIEKSRDMGASWLCVMAFFWYWLFQRRQTFLMVSRVEDYVDASGNPKSLFWKLDFALENLPLFLKPIGYNPSVHRRKMHIENPETDSVIDGESTTGKVARGDRRTAILLDEFAAVEQGASVLSSTRDATPCRIFNSTPAGTNNAFYYIRETDIRRLRLHWTIHPEKAKGLYTTDNETGGLQILDKEGYPIDHEPVLDGKTRSPWYDAECERCINQYEIAQELDIDYIGSGYQFFDGDKIQVAIKDFARTPAITGNLEYDAASGEPVRFVEHPKGKVRLWCLLDKDNNPTIDDRLIFGVDVASGTGSSNSVLSGFSDKTNEKVIEYADPHIRPEAFASFAVAIARWFAANKPTKPFLIWDAQGPGRQFGSRVIDLGYWNIYYKRRDESITKQITTIPGFFATREAKHALLGNYRAAVENGHCINRSRIALEETLEYVFLQNGSVAHTKSINKMDPSGANANHGDRVTADALAWKCISEKHSTVKIEEKPEIPVGSLAWRNKMRDDKDKKTNKELGEGWR